MPFELDITDDKLEHLGAAAVDELREVSRRFTLDVLEEAGRLEENARTADRDPEVTSSNVHDASLILRKGLLARKRRRRLKIASSIGVVSGFVVGILSDYSEFTTSVGWLIGFLVALTIATTATVYALVKE